MAHGQPKLEKLIQRRVAMVLLRDIADPRVGMITITRVKLSRDRSSCKVYWSSLEEGGARTAQQHCLEDARPFVQREVASILNTRSVPELHFSFDKSVEGMERISRLIRDGLIQDDEAARAREELGISPAEADDAQPYEGDPPSDGAEERDPGPH